MAQSGYNEENLPRADSLEQEAILGLDLSLIEIKADLPGVVARVVDDVLLSPLGRLLPLERRRLVPAQESWDADKEKLLREGVNDNAAGETSGGQNLPIAALAATLNVREEDGRDEQARSLERKQVDPGLEDAEQAPARGPA